METPSRAPFAIPARGHVILVFLLQFMVVIMALGIGIPALHERGVPTVVIVIAAAGFLVAVHYLISVLGRLIPVRCRQCRQRTRYYGFGWWPFIYRYTCPRCGDQMKLEVRGG